MATRRIVVYIVCKTFVNVPKKNQQQQSEERKSTTYPKRKSTTYPKYLVLIKIISINSKSSKKQQSFFDDLQKSDQIKKKQTFRRVQP